MVILVAIALYMLMQGHTQNSKLGTVAGTVGGFSGGAQTGVLAGALLGLPLTLAGAAMTKSGIMGGPLLFYLGVTTAGGSVGYGAYKGGQLGYRHGGEIF